MIHYHGTPITPASVLGHLAGRCFCVRYGEHRDIETCHRSGQSVMLDNGAFTFWRQGKATDWAGYYTWCERWLEFPTTWAVIPDVIDGSVEENDQLIADWPHGVRGAPVWHMHEPVERLLRLCSEWPRVCIGSSGDFSRVGDRLWRARMTEAMDQLCGTGPVPVWLHMLRGMSLAGDIFPFASADSTDIARNHAGNHTRLTPAKDPAKMAARWDALQCPSRWIVRDQLTMLGEAA